MTRENHYNLGLKKCFSATPHTKNRLHQNENFSWKEYTKGMKQKDKIFTNHISDHVDH